MELFFPVIKMRTQKLFHRFYLTTSIFNKIIFLKLKNYKGLMFFQIQF